MSILAFFNPDHGLDQDSARAAQLRGKQAENLTKLTPYMLVTNILCGGLSFIAFAYTYSYAFMSIWLFLLGCLTMTGMVAYWRNRDKKAKKFVSRRMIKKAMINAALLASFWSAMAVFVFPSVSASEKMIVIAIVSGMMGGGAISLYVVPQALYAWLGIITLGSVIGVVQDISAANVAILALICIYAAALFRAGHSISKTYVEREISSFEVQEQADTIGLLLKDFSENTSDWLWELDSNGFLTRGEDQLVETLHVSPSAFKDRNVASDEAHNTISQKTLKQLRQLFKKQESFRDIYLESKGRNGRFWVQISGKPFYDSEGEFQGYRGVASDITQSKLSEERIAFLAHNDALTGLANRSEFSRLLDTQTARSGRGQGWGVLYLDIDGFKSINDQHGHNVGDILLGLVAKRLKQCMAGSDVVARLGGDEFAILCKSASTVQSLSRIAEKIIESISRPYAIDGIPLEIGVSIGITLGGDEKTDTFNVLNNADLALYRAKAEGKGVFRFYEREMDDIVKEQRSLENDLRTALRNNELSVSYQPLISAETKKTSGFEALARWHHPERGNIPPSDFIPIAERLGIISEIGEWVLRQACLDAVEWPNDLTVAINLSPQQFKKGSIAKTVVEALKESGLEPGRLELEITEGLFMDNTQEVLATLTKLKELGISIAMDDFGTGYSSLSYILKFPFDKLKIDRSFVNSIESDDVSRNVLEAITKLGDMLNLKVTAEGVETSKQAKLLEEMSCTHFQGFYFGKPLHRHDLPGYLLNEHSVNLNSAPDEDNSSETGVKSQKSG